MLSATKPDFQISLAFSICFSRLDEKEDALIILSYVSPIFLLEKKSPTFGNFPLGK